MRKAFVSYDAERHGNYKNLIKAWEATNEYFVFNDNSTDTGINSTNTSYIKTRIKEAIRESDVFIVIVGDYASMNRWVAWECEQARAMYKNIYVIKTQAHYGIPSTIAGYTNMVILEGFNRANLSRALGNYSIFG